MKKEKYQYVGDLSQLLRVENYRLEGGRKDGVRATFVGNENGLQYTVLADRCMDIAYLSYRGINISYINPCGIVAPAYYDGRGTNWLKSFTGGFFTTCGLDNVGSPCEYKGEELGLHGRIGNTPADDYYANIIEKADNEVHINGIMNAATLFGNKLKLKREIISFQEKNQIMIKDKIINAGFQEEEYMQLYHCNIGYPFLSPECEVMIPSQSVTGANPYSERNIEKWNQIDAPSDTREMCFIHRLKNKGDISKVGMFHHKYNIGFTISFENTNLDHFMQWRYLQKGEYVLGLEPATNQIGGKAAEAREKRIKKIPPRSFINHFLQFDFFEDINLMKAFMEE